VAAATPTQTPVPTETPTPVPPTLAPVCTETTGSLDKGVITTTQLDKPMRYIVYLPPCYTFDEKQRFAVLYLLHGQNSTEEQWIRVGAVTAADQIISAKEAPPFIIVFPFDYSYKQPAEYKFEEVFINLLIPQIDSTYRTQTEVSQRAVGGLSRGGAWALRLGTRHPELFGAIGGHSPAIFYTDEKPLFKRLLEIQPDQLPRIWLDAGSNDSEYNVIVPFEQFLSENNIPHEWHEYQGWHDEKYWSAHVKEYLLWYTRNWK
jgi:enterochelin esterase-like enzyme